MDQDNVPQEITYEVSGQKQLKILLKKSNFWLA